jgi:hypothetical protein
MTPFGGWADLISSPLALRHRIAPVLLLSEMFHVTLGVYDKLSIILILIKHANAQICHDAQTIGVAVLNLFELQEYTDSQTVTAKSTRTS